MGDLDVGESFPDRVFIKDSNTGLGVTGLNPTCVIINPSGTRTEGTVSELGSGWYYCVITANVKGNWATEWSVTGTYQIYHPYKFFKVGGGAIEEIQTETDKISSIKTETDKIQSIKDKTDNLPTDPADQSDVESAITTAHSTTDGKVDAVQSDVTDIKAKTDNLPSDPADQSQVEGAITTAHTATNAKLDRKIPYIDFWSDPVASVTITGSSTDVDLPNVVIPTLPSGITIWKVVFLFIATGLQDTSGSDNAVNGASSVRLKKSTGSWGVDDEEAVPIPDNYWQIESDNGAERGGDGIVAPIGGNDLSGVVDGDGTYNSRLENIQADGANLVLLNVKVGLRIYYY
jgi:hypothetical protein